MPNRPGWPTDPEILAFIAETAKYYPEGTNFASAAEARTAYDALCEAYNLPHPDGVVTRNSAIAATNPSRDIAVRTYRDAEDIESVRTSDEKLQNLFGAKETPSTTCLMYLHGGGWVVGGLQSHDSICAEVCANVCIDVIAVDYRLCPEHQHPAALDDAEAVYHELTKTYDQIIVGGDSAGGQLTAALCMRLRRTGCEQQPAAQLLIYPALGATPEGGSYDVNAHSPGLTTKDTRHYWSLLSGGDEWRTTTDPELAPLRATDFTGLPSAIITSSGCDPLRDDAMQYAEKLTNAGVPVQWRNDPELIHGHLRARHTSHVAMTNFMWTCLALTEIRDQQDIAAMMSDSDFASLDWN